MKKISKFALTLCACAVSLTLASCGGGGGGGGETTTPPSGGETGGGVTADGYAPLSVTGKLVGGYKEGDFIAWNFMSGSTVLVTDESYGDGAMSSGTYSYQKTAANEATFTYSVNKLNQCTNISGTVTLIFTGTNSAQARLSETYTTASGTVVNVPAGAAFTVTITEGL